MTAYEMRISDWSSDVCSSDLWLAGWVQGGGVLVLAHLRGGGELGPEMWHQGRRKLKQHSFHDVYAISEDLIARGITSAAQLGVVGGSNGGTVAATVTVHRQVRFRANMAEWKDRTVGTEIVGQCK